MRSRQLETALTDFLTEAGAHLRAEVAGGAEVPFELAAQGGRRGSTTTPPLYTYKALTAPFIAERDASLKRLPGHAPAAKLLEGFDGLDRYLASVGGEAARAKGRTRVRAAMRALMQDVFDEQSEFELRPERLQGALARLEQAVHASASELSLVATLHGVTICSAELPLAKGLRIAQRDALQGAPEEATSALLGAEDDHHVLVVFTSELEDVSEGLVAGREVLRELLSALRLFGDGRVALGPLAWMRAGHGNWAPIALGSGGRPRGMLVVTVEQEDELRAFCNLASRRAPHDDELAWALRRFELGCERADAYEALSDHVLALRALLEPEGSSSGLLAGRLAALCATPTERAKLTERIVEALELERSIIAGTARRDAAGHALADDVADHLRALLRDVICGHLDPDLAAIADELLEDEEQENEELVQPSLEPELEPAAAPSLAPAAEHHGPGLFQATLPLEAEIVADAAAAPLS